MSTRIRRTLWIFLSDHQMRLQLECTKDSDIRLCSRSLFFFAFVLVFLVDNRSQVYRRVLGYYSSGPAEDGFDMRKPLAKDLVEKKSMVPLGRPVQPSEVGVK